MTAPGGRAPSTAIDSGPDALHQPTARTMLSLRATWLRELLAPPQTLPTSHGWFLQFDDAGLERSYCRAHDRAATRHVRYATAYLAILTALSGIVEVAFSPFDHVGRSLLLLRYGVSIPMLLAVFALTKWKGAERRIQPIICAGFCGYAWLYAVPALNAVPAPLAPVLLSLWPLILAAGMTTTRMRGRWAVAASLGVTAAALTSTMQLLPGWAERTVLVYVIALALALFSYVAWQQERGLRNEYISSQRIHEQHDKALELLWHILPRDIAERMRVEGRAIADGFDDVTILFSDLVGFTSLAAHTAPAVLLRDLDELVSMFDDLAGELGLEKIKTIGDAYMVAGGLPTPDPLCAAAVARMALGMRAAVEEFNRRRGKSWSLRIGIHSGPVVAGVIGKRKFVYDLWGDTVNLASRMESHGTPGAIQVSEATWLRLRDRFVLDPRGEIEVKGRGAMRTWWLLGEMASDER